MHNQRKTICVEDFSRICRICLLSKEVAFMSVPSLELYIKVTNIQIEKDDNLPKNICKDCFIELENVTSFIDKCKEIDSFLRSVLEKSNTCSYNSPCEQLEYESDISDSRSYEEVKIKVESGFKKTFSRKNRKNLSRVKIITDIESKYNCTQCDRILTSHSALNSHMKTHTGEKPYSCSYCDKRFPYISSLTVHTRLHTGETPFICPICNKGYRSSTSLKKHKEVKHYEIEDVTQEDDTTGCKNEEILKEADKRECKICNKILHKHGFGTHMRIHTIERKKFVCTFCNKNFQKNSHLERHIRTHTGERPYICKQCCKTFKQDGDLKRHVLTHTGEKQFQCQHCGKQYYTKGSLDTHLSVHTGIKRPVNYECNICKKSFRQCTHFKTHMSSHTGEKPYLCTICGKSFTASGTLKVHTRIHTGETPFVCSYCSKGYNNSSSLKRHIMRNHTGEKPYVCMICHKGFHDSTNLKRHIKRVHSVMEIKDEGEDIEMTRSMVI